MHGHNLLMFYENKSILSHTSTLHNNKRIKTTISKRHQVKKTRIKCAIAQEICDTLCLKKFNSVLF